MHPCFMKYMLHVYTCVHVWRWVCGLFVFSCKRFVIVAMFVMFLCDCWSYVAFQWETFTCHSAWTINSLFWILGSLFLCILSCIGWCYFKLNPVLACLCWLELERTTFLLILSCLFRYSSMYILHVTLSDYMLSSHVHVQCTCNHQVDIMCSTD